MKHAFPARVVLLALALLAAVSTPALAGNALFSDLKAHSLAEPHLQGRLTAHGLTRAVGGHAVSRNSAGQLRVVVYLNTDASAPALATLAASGFQLIAADASAQMAEGWVTPEQLGNLSQLAIVRFVASPARPRARVGSVTSEGVSIIKADQLQAKGVRGAGARVGVISDGIIGLAQAKASGDLPANVAIIADPCSPDGAGSCAEGTAMMEIVHDIAPDAALGFCGADSLLGMQNCINDLVKNFRANIIVDDLGFPDEAMFEDSALSKTINSQASQGLLYASAAGNGNGCYYEADYKPGSPPPGGFYDSRHDFGLAGLGASRLYDQMVVGPLGSVELTLQWNDPFARPTNDYDLFLEDSNGNILAQSTDVQNGFSAPAMEILQYQNPGNQPLNVRAVVLRKAGAQTRRLKMTFSDGSSGCDGILPISYTTGPGSIYGHPAATGAIAVGAVDATTPPYNVIEYYSDLGPVRIDFPVLQLRQKPDISGLDDVSVSGAGGFGGPGGCPLVCFSGTSAAAPHIAGLLALLKGNFTGNLRQGLMTSAISLGDANTYGAGMPDVVAAAALLNTPPRAAITQPSSHLRVSPGQQLNLQASCTDPERLGTNSYSWNLGPNGAGPATLTASTVFSTLGTFTVSFTCKDNYGAASNTAQATITVTNNTGGSSGGAFGLLPFALLAALGWLRRRA
jgi:hypothetical protein